MKIFNTIWETTTAGPSPDQNKRTELFLFGCKRAMNGNPCEQCFNTKLWDSSVAEYEYTPEEIAENIDKYASNKYITISGGEPLDQIDELIELCSLLKEKGFHILVYTWRELNRLLDIRINSDIDGHFPPINSIYKVAGLMQHIDILVDGEFDSKKNLYDSNKDDGLLNSVGSGNQIIWDISGKYGKILEGYKLEDLDALFIKDNNELVYIVKDMEKGPEIINM